jgi:hypothetical protein
MEVIRMLDPGWKRFGSGIRNTEKKHKAVINYIQTYRGSKFSSFLTSFPCSAKYLVFSFAKFRSYLVDDLLLGNEVPQAHQVDIPSLCADEQALAARLQAEGGDGLEPALQAGLAIKNPPKKPTQKTHPKKPQKTHQNKPTKIVFFGVF